MITTDPTYLPDVVKTKSVAFDSRDKAIESLTAQGFIIGTGPFKNRVYQKTKTGLKLIGKLNEKK